MLGVILVVASILRFVDLGDLSLWYDEVVTMRIARQPGPAALVKTLREIDATRAPLHPLVLQGWLRVFGTSDASGRALSALCGILTVLVIHRLARGLFESESAGLASAWLAAVSPLLVMYSREVRMYAWLTLLTCLSWWTVERMSRKASVWTYGAYVGFLAGLVYSHPLGLLMASALALVTLIYRGRLHLSLAAWLALHVSAGLLILPWLPNYLDHPPALVSREWLALRYVLGLPIGFVGGNRFALLGCVAVIAFGLAGAIRPRPRLDRPFAASLLLIWFLLPPALLYAYSLLEHPIFGQARYCLFVGPAYLVLLGRGLAKLPLPLGLCLGAGLALLSARMLEDLVYQADYKTDWRSVSRFVKRETDRKVPVVVFSNHTSTLTGKDTMAEVARYYFGPGREVVVAHKAPKELLDGRKPACLAVGQRDGKPAATRPPFPEIKGARLVDFPDLRLVLPPGPSPGREE